MKYPKQILFLVLVFASQILQGQTDTLKPQANIAMPAFTLSINDLEGMERSQNISGLLQSSRDIFVNRAGYTFGPARYRIRGYDSEYTTVMIHGVEVNDPESGRAYWASWGGLNDALRNQDVKTGIVNSNLGFGGIGGITNIETRASSYARQVKLSLSVANRSYRNRLMFTASTGLMENGWAVVVSGSRRWAEEGYVKGTFYDAYSYFLSIEKKLSATHSLSLVAFGSPNKRGRSGVSTQEAYDLAGSHFYNPYWGYQDGKIRNARVAHYHQPMIMLSHYYEPSRETKIKTTAYLNFGRGGSTALGWAEAADPRPDYYKNLPSYYLYQDDYQEYLQQVKLWQDDEEIRQIDWDYFYFANSKYLFPVDNANGIEGNDISILRSKFIVEEWRNDKLEYGLNSVLNHRFNEHIQFFAGVNLMWDKGSHFKTIVDLLGGEYWLDIDKYADQESFVISNQSQSDLRYPNRLVTEGDVFGYNYDANIEQHKGYAAIDLTYSKIDLYAGFQYEFTRFWRTGNMKNGKFPDHSLGDSPKNSFHDFGLKGGITYKINGRNFISGNAAYMTQAPTFRSAYISPRTRDFTIPDLKSENIMSGDISYILRSPNVKSRLTLYYTEITNQTWARSFYYELKNTFVNYIMTGIDKVYSGLELGIDAKVSPTLSLNGVLGKGQFLYNSRPHITVAQDNDAELIIENETAYINGYYIGGRPQTVGSFGIKYDSPQYWFLSFNVNYFDDIYIQLNPDRRTEPAIEGLYENDVRLEKILHQQKLSTAITLDFFGGKSWKINNYLVSLTVSVSNILNNTDFRIGGFEQYRFDPENISKFPPKYFYLYGRTYFINLSVRI